MTQHQLPAYLQNRQVADFTDYASDGLGTALPPHVSIQGNMFTLIDATGQEYQPMATMDVVIVDRSKITCKMYYDKPWVPGSDEPPVCWSTNGVGPSRDAPIPQSPTCQECKFNVRGSAISKISGASIKACRDEYHMAILLPAIPNMMFRYVLTPGSFENWGNYTAQFKNSNVQISMVLTQMGFQPKVNGVVTFKSVAYIDEATDARVQQALLEKATDALVGRNDVPRPAGAIAAPAAMQQPDSALQQLGPFVPSTPAPAAPLAAFPTPVAEPAAVAQQTATEAPRRRRRTQAEMQAANGAASPQQPAPEVQLAPQAPFPHPGAPAAPAAPAGAFGIAPGTPAAADPGVSTMLDSFFGKQ